MIATLVKELSILDEHMQDPDKRFKPIYNEYIKEVSK